jgi:hypothetical protein
MPARGDLSACTEGRRSKAPQEGTRGGRMGGCCLWGFYGAAVWVEDGWPRSWRRIDNRGAIIVVAAVVDGAILG